MYLLIDDNALVASGFAASLRREGVALTSFGPAEFSDWLVCAAPGDLLAVEAFLLGAPDSDGALLKIIRQHSVAPVIAISAFPSLDNVLALFAAGADDVVRKPVHVRELLARVQAVRARSRASVEADLGGLIVYCDGRPPAIDGAPLELPRRERRILEFLVVNRGRWLTKQQVFAAVYGLFDDVVQDTVVESHVSKLRRKLTASMGADPIESKRYLGYRIA